MKTTMALKIFKDYQQSNLKQRTVIGYRYLLNTFEELFGERDLTSITSEEIVEFLELLTETRSQTTKRHRYAQLKAFFNFIIMNYEHDLRNPVDTPMMRKTFRLPKRTQREIIAKELIDEVIFTSKTL